MATLRTLCRERRYFILVALAVGSSSLLGQESTAQATTSTPSAEVERIDPAEHRHAQASEAYNYVSDISLWEWRDLQGAVKISIHSMGSHFDLGEPVFLLIAVHNSSANPRVITNTRPPYMFRVFVEGQDKTEVPKTRLGSFLNVPMHFSTYTIQLNSGDTLGYVLELRRMYDLTVPGSYRVKVKMPSLALDTQVWDEAESNQLEFRIVNGGLPSIHELISRLSAPHASK